MVKRLGERPLKTRFGTYNEVLYYDGRKEAIALVMGDVTGGENILCRVHSNCIGGHVFNSIECDCQEQLEASQATIQEEGRGLIIWLDQEGKGNGHLALIKSIPFKNSGYSQAEAYAMAGYSKDARDYRAAAGIINDLQIKSIVLLASGTDKAEALAELSVVVTETL